MKKTFLITGATKGIGLATAEHLSRMDHTVVGIARNNPKMSFPGTLYLADLSQIETTQDIFNIIKNEFKIDGIINNVGVSIPQPIEEISLASFQQVMDINLIPAIQAMQTFLPEMKKSQWGRVVNITSRAMLGKSGRTSYSAAKAGLAAMTRTWALELAPFGITVNAVAPGPIETEGFSQNYAKGSPEQTKLLAGIPLGRMGQPEEVAHVISFFLSELSAFITGQTLFVDGGGSIGVQYD